MNKAKVKELFFYLAVFLITFTIGILLVIYVPNMHKEPMEATMHKYEENVKVIQPIRQTKYIGFELNQIGLSELKVDQEVPLYLMNAFISNPVYQRYENNAAVRMLIDKEKVERIISFKEFIEIKCTIRDVYAKAQDKEEQVMLNMFVKHL